MDDLGFLLGYFLSRESWSLHQQDARALFEPFLPCDDVQLRRVYLRLALKYHPDKHPKAIWWWQDRLGKILGPQKGDKQYRIGGETSNIFSFSTLPAEMIQFDFCISFKKRGETTKNRFRFEFPFRIFGLLGWCELLVVCCSQGFRFRILGFQLPGLPSLPIICSFFLRFGFVGMIFGWCGRTVSGDDHIFRKINHHHVGWNVWEIFLWIILKQNRADTPKISSPCKQKYVVCFSKSRKNLFKGHLDLPSPPSPKKSPRMLARGHF